MLRGMCFREWFRVSSRAWNTSSSHSKLKYYPLETEEGKMQCWGRRGALWGVVLTVVLVMNVAWAQGQARGRWGGVLPVRFVMNVDWAQAPARGKLERLIVAVAPLGWDTNFTWLQSRSGMLDKRPALESLVGMDRNTGAT